MRLTERLLGFLNRVFDKDPKAFVAMRVEGSSDWSWSITDRVLRLTHDGGVATFDLADMTLAELFQDLSALPGFVVTAGDGERLGLKASVLLDGAGDVLGGSIAPLTGYTSLLWAFMEGWAVELFDLQVQVSAAPSQLNLNEGTGVWLDEIGSHYGVTRGLNEPDPIYGPRVIAEALRPRSNNVALEAAIKVYTGQDATVTDVEIADGTFPLHDGTIDHDGAYNHDAQAVFIYGLFDVVYGFDLEQGNDITSFQAELRKLIGRLRAAGTHLRALALQSSSLADAVLRPADSTSLSAQAEIGDAVSAPGDAMTVSASAAGMSDSVQAPSEASVIQIPRQLLRDGRIRRNGVWIHSEHVVMTQNLEGTISSVLPV